MISRSKPEYGGFLPLELNEKQEFFEDYKANLRRFNSIKAALYFLIGSLRVKKIYIPYYYCPTTIRAIKNTGIDVIFYHITPDLLPEPLPDDPDIAVLLVNYFGVITEDLNRLASGYHNAVVVIDNAHSFFSAPVMRERLYQVYSAKKFFGVPDGAYLIGKEITYEDSVMGNSYEYADYLLLTYESGTNAAYKLKKSADRLIEEHPGNMSALAYGLLRNVDYDSVRKKRIGNFNVLYDKLGAINELSFSSGGAAYLYPFLLQGFGWKLKKKLVNEKIYVPTLWNGEDLMNCGNDFELTMSNDAVFLPIDQRYDQKDMEYISDCLLFML